MLEDTNHTSTGSDAPSSVPTSEEIPHRIPRTPTRPLTAPMLQGVSAVALAKGVGGMTNAQLGAHLTALASAEPNTQLRETLAEAGARLKELDAGAAAVADDVPLYLDSDVDVMRPDPARPGATKQVRLKGGRFLSELDLSQDEVDELTKHGAIRHATHHEIRAERDRRAASAQ
ncbi:MAG TPA: hypothetical protein VGM50_13705 [Gemmatimonadaceae bacterium]|jgi:hypothetical protein